MASWYEGELFPVGKEFPNAPVGAMAPGGECTHDHVVAPQQADGIPASTQGRMALHCLDCEETWWEDMACVKGSPWAGK